MRNVEPIRIARWISGTVLVAGGGAAAFAATWDRSPGERAVVALSAAGRPVRWVRAEILIEPVESPGLPRGALREAFTIGENVWNDALDDCGAPRIRVASERSARTTLARDGLSVVFVRTKRWCPETPADPDDCYDGHRAAITHLYPSDPPGLKQSEVREADIEINAVDFHWSLEGDDAGSRSLRALAVHELGHALGLDHPCSTSPTQRPARRPCAPGDRQLVMYPASVELGREPALQPSAAEVDAVCSIYRDARSSGRGTSESGR